jgi:hypothetical protein
MLCAFIIHSVRHVSYVERGAPAGETHEVGAVEASNVFQTASGPVTDVEAVRAAHAQCTLDDSTHGNGARRSTVQQVIDQAPAAAVAAKNVAASKQTTAATGLNGLRPHAHQYLAMESAHAVQAAEDPYLQSPMHLDDSEISCSPHVGTRLLSDLPEALGRGVPDVTAAGEHHLKDRHMHELAMQPRSVSEGGTGSVGGTSELQSQNSIFSVLMAMVSNTKSPDVPTKDEDSSGHAELPSQYHEAPPETPQENNVESRSAVQPPSMSPLQWRVHQADSRSPWNQEGSMLGGSTDAGCQDDTNRSPREFQTCSSRLQTSNAALQVSRSAPGRESTLLSAKPAQDMKKCSLQSCCSEIITRSGLEDAQDVANASEQYPALPALPSEKPSPDLASLRKVSSAQDVKGSSGMSITAALAGKDAGVDMIPTTRGSRTAEQPTQEAGTLDELLGAENHNKVTGREPSQSCSQDARSVGRVDSVSNVGTLMYARNISALNGNLLAQDHCSSKLMCYICCLAYKVKPSEETHCTVCVLFCCRLIFSEGSFISSQ